MMTELTPGSVTVEEMETEQWLAVTSDGTLGETTNFWLCGQSPHNRPRVRRFRECGEEMRYHLVQEAVEELNNENNMLGVSEYTQIEKIDESEVPDDVLEEAGR